MSLPRLLLVCPGETPGALVRTVATEYAVTAWVQGRFPQEDLPEVILFSRPVSRATQRQVSHWKRRHCPDALMGGNVAPSEAMDFFMAADESALSRLRTAGIHRRRILLEGAQPLPDFLRARMVAQSRSLLWVEEDLSLKSPSTKHLVTSIPTLLDAGWEISVWCFSADALDPCVDVELLPSTPKRLGPFAPYWFWLVANLRGSRRRRATGRAAARVVQTVGGAYLGADISAIHFVNQLWLYRQLELGLTSLDAVVVFLWTLLAMGKDWLQFRNPRCRLFLPVSESIAAEVRRRVPRGATVTVLPNSYDETRFNPAIRQQWREPMRAELSFAPDETVFCFASQGHYRRKGFWLAVEGIARAANPKARLLVIGGLPRTLEKLKGELGLRFPNWSQWITFVGTQSAVERYYSAADAFLFPSYFEAFCLAEIEAGALGLPLLLTPHNGIEMILRDGKNGMLLSYEPKEIARTIERYIAEGLPPFAASPGRALGCAAYANTLAQIYESYYAARYP